MGFGERLGLGGRSATFLATVQLHELAQVPLVHAKFRVKWKFKGSRSHFGGDGGYADDGASMLSGSSGGKKYLHPLSAVPAPRPRTRSSSSQRDSTAEDSSGSSRPSQDNHNSLPTSPSFPSSDRTPNPNRTPMVSFGGFNPFNASSPSSPGSPTPVGSPETVYSPRPGEGSALSPSPTYGDEPNKRRDSNPPTAPAPVGPSYSEPKGSTLLAPLRSHAATFNREIYCRVAIPVRATPGSSRYTLQPSPLRLAVRQEVLADGGKREEVKTGEVVLDLSQFVGNGKGEYAVPRRYLLNDCKTNATLRVTVKMEWVGGEHDYWPSSLKSGMVQEAVTSAQVLSNSSFNRSSSSVNSSRKTVPSTNGSIPMTRTNSSGSLSIHSLHSLHSLHSSKSIPISSSPTKTKGWRPTISAFTSSPTPSLLGGPSGSDRGATDIIENIFNRAPRDYGGAPHPPAKLPNGGATPSDGPVFVAKRSQNSSASSSTKGKDKESWFKISSSPTSSTSPQTSPALQSTARFPQPSRRLSSASVNSANSKPRSVRWGDDEVPPPPPNRKEQKKGGLSPAMRSSSSTSLNGLNDVGEDTEEEVVERREGRKENGGADLLLGVRRALGRGGEGELAPRGLQRRLSASSRRSGKDGGGG